MALFSVINVDPHGAENTKNDEYDDRCDAGEQETNKQGITVSSSGIIVGSIPRRLRISVKCKGYQDNVQKHPDLNQTSSNQTNPNSCPVQNVSKLVCKKINRR